MHICIMFNLKSLVYKIFYRPGSIIADLEATLLNHPDAEPIFAAVLRNLDLSHLFADDPVLSMLPDVPREKHYLLKKYVNGKPLSSRSMRQYDY